MCGRYSITTPVEAMRDVFGFVDPPRNLPPRYNAAPTQALPVIREVRTGERELASLHWGLIPRWARDRTIAAKLINARGETVDEKPSFREAFRQRRCLVPADAFYEWKSKGAVKQPYRVHLPNDRLFAFAGLWETWRPAKSDPHIESFTIVTTDASPEIAEIHHRMPVILPEDAYAGWLSPESDSSALKSLLVPYQGEILAHPVGLAVNNVRNDGPECAAPAKEQAPAQGALF